MCLSQHLVSSFACVEASAFASCQGMPSLQLVRGTAKPPLCEALIWTLFLTISRIFSEIQHLLNQVVADAHVVLFCGLLRDQTRANQGMS